MLKLVSDGESPKADEDWWKIEVLLTDQVTEIVKQEGFPEEIEQVLEKLGEGALYCDTRVHLNSGHVNLMTVTRNGHSVHFLVENGKAVIFHIDVRPPVEAKLPGPVWFDVIMAAVKKIVFWR